MVINLGLLAVALVSGGEAKASVVLPADARPHERTAAEELVAWTRALTGAELPVAETPQAGLTPVRFARADDEVRYDGFSLTASASEVVIAANEPIGVLFGVYYALNRFGGIVWSHPDAEADVPKSPDFAVPDGRLVKIPMAVREGHRAGNGALSTSARRERVAWWNVRNGFATRGYRRGGDPAKTQPGNSISNGLMERLGDWGEAVIGGHVLGELVLEAPIEDAAELEASLAWTKAHAGEIFVKRPSGEQLSKYARWRVLVKRHPAWFGLVDGARVPTGISLRQRAEIRGPSSMPCLSNPEVRARICRGFRARQAQLYPGQPVTFSICCDDNSQWCECDSCLKLLKGKGAADDREKASDYWWDFVNDISARLLSDPLVSLKVYVYRNYQAYPKRVRPVRRPRLSIVLCPHGRCYLHSLTDSRCKSNVPYRAMFEEWAKTGNPVETFEYMNQVPGKCNYAFWERAWIEDVKWYMANGIRHGSGGLVGPWDGYASADDYFRRNAAKARWQIAWLTGHFEWDPDDDFDAVRDRLFTVYYRAAATPMKAYRARLEQALYATSQCMCYGSGGTLFTAAAFQSGVLAEAKRLLDEAAACATGDVELERRVAADAAWFASNWESSAASGDTAAAIARTDAAPTLDGRLDEPFWRQAAVVDDFRRIVSIGDTPKLAEARFAPATTLRLAFDATNLYLSCVCAKANGKVVDVPADGSTFEAMKGSHLQFYFLSSGLGGLYHHVAVSHNGKTYSALTTNGKTRDLGRKLDFRHAIADSPEAWTLEMAIPLSAFGGAKAGDVWKIDVARTAAGADGRVIRGYGSLCGYGQHMPEYWKAFSFGAPSNLLANGSFEDLVAPPVLGPSNRLNGKGWQFLSEKMPAAWFYQQNGGIGEAVTAGAAEGRAFLRLKSPKRGCACYLWQDIHAYPSDTKTLRFSFRARGRGMVTARVIQHPKETVRVKTLVDSSVWRDFSCEIPLGELHPTRFMVNVAAEQMDLDDFRLEAEGGISSASHLTAASAKVDAETVRFDEGRLLMERYPSKRLVVEDNLRALQDGRVPDYAVGNVIRWLELNGRDMSEARARFRPVEAPLGEPPLRRKGFRLGYMLDVSRDKVPTMATLKTMVDVLAAAGFNEFQLYTEHTFAYAEHETAWRGWSPMTAAEVRELDAYAWSRGVRLVPNQNSFGHLEKWLCHPEYVHLAAAPDGYRLDRPKVKSVRPCAVNPCDPRTYAFLDGLYGELLPNFAHADEINVGCDEVWDIFDAHARCAARAKEIGVPRLYMEHLLKVHDLVAKRGKRMAFWAEMVLRDPELLPLVPTDVNALQWGYGSEWGTPGYSCEFAGRCLALRRRGIPFTVCPSTRTYEHGAYAFPAARGNVEIAVDSARRYGAEGLLLTEWGDGGHPRPFLASLPAIALTGLACRGAATDDAALAAEIDRLAGLPVGEALIRWGTMRTRLRDRPDLAKGRAALMSIETNDAPAWIVHGVKTMRLNHRVLELREAKEPISSELRDEYRRLWLEANRPGGLEDSVRQALGSAGSDIVLENANFRLTLGGDARARSLVVNATGEEMLDAAARTPFCAVVQPRPFNNELKLAYPNKRTVFPANRVRRDGDRLVFGFELIPYEAEVAVEVADGFAAFTLSRFLVDREAQFEGLKMDVPPVSEFRVVQLPVRERANFGAWLNVMHDDRAALAVVGTSPWPRVDAEARDGCRAASGAAVRAS